MAVAINLGADGALLDYSDLVEKVKLWLDRGSELDTYIPTYIKLLEDYLNDNLRVPEMEVTVAAQPVGGRFRLPFDCEAVRFLGKPRSRGLTAMSPSELMAAYGACVGEPQAYAISGVYVDIAPISAGPLDLVYHQRIPPLSLNAPNNWVLDKRPSVYLYGSLAAAEGYIDNPEAESKWGGLFENAVASLAKNGNKARYGGPLVARSPVRAIGGVRA